MSKKKKKEEREPVQVGVTTKRKVEKHLIGDKDKRSLGEFYSQAAEEKLKSEKQ